MRAMRRWVIAFTCVVSGVGLGCKSSSTAPRGDGFHVDPWAAKPDTGGGGDGEMLPSLGGDSDDTAAGIGQMAKLVIENLKKPGPYEAPEHGAGYDKAKPHVGVMDLSGAIVEREAFSFSLLGGVGGRGTELRQLEHRFAELGKDANLTGLLLRVDGLGISLPDAI